MRFNATGNLVFNSLDSKLPWKREGKTKNGDKYESVNIAIASTKANRMMSECFGMVSDEIQTMNTDNEKISIDWSDRNDPDVISKVASYKKHIVNLTGDDRKEFITDYDFVKYIDEHVDELKDGKFVVTGDSTLNEYNGKLSHRFRIQNIYKADEDAKNQLRITMDFYWMSDGIDFADWKEEKKIRISGYTTAYIAGEKKNMYVPQDTILDASRIDFSNPKHVKLLEFKLKQLGLNLDGDKPVNNLKKNKVYRLPLICNYYNGSQEIEFDKSMLTPNQREALELGLKTLESFIPAGSKVYGDRIIEYRIVDFDLRGDFDDGCIITDTSVKEFEEEIYTPVAPETESEILENNKKSNSSEKKKSNKEVNEETDDEDDILDLFD